VADCAALRLELQEQQSGELRAHVQRLLAPLRGDERSLDSGCGAGALAFALAPLVGSVVGIDTSEELVAAGREHAPANCELLVGDATALPFPFGAFDLTGCTRVLHHVRRPELVVAELARVTKPGGRILVADQLGAVDPVVSVGLDRFERARDPSHQRLLPDQDLRSLFDANDLHVTTNEIVRERRNIDRYLDLVGLEGVDRERVRRMAPGEEYDVEIGWYVLRTPGG
jgi:ubiquinone/menaquinone biosynthesis C-methylase UbiE